MHRCKSTCLDSTSLYESTYKECLRELQIDNYMYTYITPFVVVRDATFTWLCIAKYHFKMDRNIAKIIARIIVNSPSYLWLHESLYVSAYKCLYILIPKLRPIPFNGVARHFIEKQMIESTVLTNRDNICQIIYNILEFLCCEGYIYIQPLTMIILCLRIKSLFLFESLRVLYHHVM